MKLSVIVPSLAGNVPARLREQVAHRSDVELIVVRGVSPVGKARAEGLAQATGEYIAWVDADDEISDDWTVRILKAADRHPDLIAFGYEINGHPFSPTGELVEEMLRGATRHMSLWGMVVRRELWTGCGFDRTAAVMEDWGVLPSVMSRAFTFEMIPKVLYRYRPMAGGTSASGGLGAEVDRRLAIFEQWFRKSAWNSEARYRRARLEGVARMRCWFRTPGWRRWLAWRLPLLWRTRANVRQKLKWTAQAGGFK